MEKEIRYIVRIAGKDLDGNLPIYKALSGIKGISHRMGTIIAVQFEKQSGVAFDSKLGLIEEDKDKELEKIVQKPEEFGVPNWALNKRKDFNSGRDWHATMAELDLELRKDLQRLKMIKSYRGLRHSWGLPVRGQRTKSTHRGKGPVVGVTKKEARAAVKATQAQEKKPAEKKK